MSQKSGTPTYTYSVGLLGGGGSGGVAQGAGSAVSSIKLVGVPLCKLRRARVLRACLVKDMER